MKLINLNLYSWHPHCNSEGWKQEPVNGVEGVMAENRPGSEAEESLRQMDEIPIDGVTTEKGEPKTFNAFKR